MNSHYIVKNGNRETGEMSVFEAVEVLNNFKGLSSDEDKVEIHSFCRHWALKKDGKINQREIFRSREEADEKWWELKPNFIDVAFEIVEVREFNIWFRLGDFKDSIRFYTFVENLEYAVEEAIKRMNVSFAIEYDGEIVSRHGENYVRNPEKRRLNF